MDLRRIPGPHKHIALVPQWDFLDFLRQEAAGLPTFSLRMESEVTGLVEKPSPEEAPSNLAVLGRYILPSSIFDAIDNTKPGSGGEIQLTDAMAQLIGRQKFHAVKVDAVRHDCGDKAGYVIANLALALEREDIAPTIREFLGRA